MPVSPDVVFIHEAQCIVLLKYFNTNPKWHSTSLTATTLISATQGLLLFPKVVMEHGFMCK